MNLPARLHSEACRERIQAAMEKDDDGLRRITEQIIRSNPEPMDVSAPAASSSTGQVQPATSSNTAAPNSASPAQAPSRGIKRDAPTAELPEDAKDTSNAMQMLSNLDAQHTEQQTTLDADVVNVVKGLRETLYLNGLLGALDAEQHVDELEPRQLHPER